jgi:hypothetical protein
MTLSQKNNYSAIKWKAAPCLIGRSFLCFVIY